MKKVKNKNKLFLLLIIIIKCSLMLQVFVFKQDPDQQHRYEIARFKVYLIPRSGKLEGNSKERKIRRKFQGSEI